VRKDLLRPERAQLAGEDGYRFRHLLIRDAAYEALPKATRAELHERFAAWLEARGAELVELDEIVGYHLEQAFKYRGELGPLTDSDRDAGGRAAKLFARAGRRALERGDRRAAANLLERAARLLPDDAPEQILTLVFLGRILVEAGDDYQGARVALERAAAAAKALQREDLLVRAQIELSLLDQLTDPGFQPEESEALARRAIEVLEGQGDEEGLARAWYAIALSDWARGRWDALREPLTEAIEHARRAGSKSSELEAVIFLLVAMVFGSTPASEGIAAARRVREEYPDSLELQGWASRVLGTFLGLQGDEEAGRQFLEQARAIFAELGHKEALAALSFSTGGLKLTAGNPAAAEREFRAGLELFQIMGERARASTLAAFLVQALVDQGRIEEAEEYVDVSRDMLADRDPSGEGLMKIAAARVLARRGRLDEAIRVAAEAVAIAEAIEELLNLPDLLLWQAEILEMAGRTADAEAALRKAADAAERKGAVVDERRAEQRLAALAEASR
jgi:tetratricopeptide (TPR) repeat protein